MDRMEKLELTRHIPTTYDRASPITHTNVDGYRNGETFINI